MTQASNSIIDTSTMPGLREYYHVSSLMLWSTYCEFENHLDKRAQEIVCQYQKESKNNADPSQHLPSTLHYIQVQLATQLRYALLPRFLGVLERMMKAMCKINCPEDKVTKGKGSWLERHVKLLEKNGVSFVDVQDDIENTKNLIIIRNCIVHANGEIEACKDSEAVTKAIKALGENDAGIFSEGFLSLGDQVIPTAQIAMSNIMVELFKHYKFPLSRSRW